MAFSRRSKVGSGFLKQPVESPVSAENRLIPDREIVVSYETIRRWATKFGPDYTRRLKRKTPVRFDIWHFDEAVVTISGYKHWLWRAVD